MAFGQQSGPPASSSQLRELLSLLKESGHESFRDARGAMGFTQRQAGGKFTRDEATGFIDRLQDPGLEAATPAPPASKAAAADQLMRHMSTEMLVTELERRGWTVTKP